MWEVNVSLRRLRRGSITQHTVSVRVRGYSSPAIGLSLTMKQDKTTCKFVYKRSPQYIFPLTIFFAKMWPEQNNFAIFLTQPTTTHNEITKIPRQNRVRSKMGIPRSSPTNTEWFYKIILALLLCRILIDNPIAVNAFPLTKTGKDKFIIITVNNYIMIILQRSKLIYPNRN